MTFHASWLVKERVAFIHQTGISTVEELEAIIHTQIALQEQGNGTVHIVHYADDLHTMTFGLNDIKKMLNLPQVTPNNGWFLFVSADRFKRFTANIAAQFNGGRHREFANIEEAIAFLQDLDDSLGKIPMPTPDYERAY